MYKSLFVLLVSGFCLVSCLSPASLEKDISRIEDYLTENSITAQSSTSGLHYVIDSLGSGDPAEAGKVVSVHYTGKLMEDGSEFDSSIGKDPIDFILGAGMVIPGFDEGVALLNEGGAATLYIPSNLGYGFNGAGGGTIPPNANLIFEVHLVDVE